MAMASLNLSRMFCGSATPEFSRTNLQMGWASTQQGHKCHGVSVVNLTQVSEAEYGMACRGQEQFDQLVCHLSYLTPFLSASVSNCSKDVNSSSAMLQPAHQGSLTRLSTAIAGQAKAGSRLVLTSTAICQLNGVGQVRCSVVALISVPCAVVPDELGIDVYCRNIVDDAADLELRVFQQMSQQCGFACENLCILLLCFEKACRRCAQGDQRTCAKKPTKHSDRYDIMLLCLCHV